MCVWFTCGKLSSVPSLPSICLKKSSRRRGGLKKGSLKNDLSFLLSFLILTFNLKAGLFLALIHPHLIFDRRTQQFYLTRQKNKTKTNENVLLFFAKPGGRWICSCAASDSDFITYPRKKLSVNQMVLLHRLAQGYGATAPPQQCYIVRYI